MEWGLLGGSTDTKYGSLQEEPHTANLRIRLWYRGPGLSANPS